MCKMPNWFLLIFFVYSVHSEGYDIVNQLCTEVSNKDACNNLERDQIFECSENINSIVDCVLNINNGKQQFALLQPEQALLAANFVSNNVNVIGEIIAEKPTFQTVVIARKFYNSLEDLRNKHFCHPGFKHDELVSRYILQEFEAKIIELNSSYCESDAETVLEKQLSALSSFFGPTCRPGEWAVDDPALDDALKTKYSNLCDLCGPEKCNVNYQEPFQDALTCLSRNGGDVAVTSLSHALKFFNDSNNIDNFVYVCSDGKPKNPRHGNCTFTDQMNRIIISDQSIVDVTRNYLDNNYPSIKSPNGFVMQSLDIMPLKDALDFLLELSKTDNLKLIDPVPLKAYVSRHRKIPSVSNNTYCKKTVKWCTTNKMEQKKCLWLKQAALNAGLQPVIKCIQSQYDDRISCINDIKRGKSDVAFIDVNYGYRALKSGLTYIAFPETYNKDLSTIVIAVSNDSTINNLKGKKACIPQYEGKEWLAFIETLNLNKVMSKKSCDYNEIFVEFVGDSCVPGAKNKYFDVKNPEKLCAQCVPITNVFNTKKTCNNDQENKYYKTDGALKCIEDKAGDYAVVTVSDMVQYRGKTNNFKAICRNGAYAETAGLSVDSDCALTIITTGGIVMKSNTLKRSNIIQLLKGIDLEFGQSLRKTFKVFERFDGVPDLLFPDSTFRLLFDGEEFGKPVENFKALLGNTEKCVAKPNIAHHLMPSTLLMIILTIIVRF